MTAPRATRMRSMAHCPVRVAWSSARACAAALAFATFVGCATPPAFDRGAVSHEVEARFGAAIGSAPTGNNVLVVEGLERGQPLGEEQAVMLALFNNAAFHEALVELDLTRADLIQAGLLPNPEFVYFWPEPNKPLKYLIEFPIEALWLRPVRLKVAAAENGRACARLTQLALDLIRDTRVAFNDLRLARDQVRVAERSVDIRGRVAELAEKRLRGGVASELDVSIARTDALQAVQELTRQRYEVTVAQERLRNLTGLSGFSFDLTPVESPLEPRLDGPIEKMVADAVATRPDAVAAMVAAQAAAERVRVAQLGWMRLLGILDATSGRASGHEFGPGLRVTVPIFNQGQGGIVRAEAELEQANRRRQTVHNQIVQDVRTAFARYQQARAELDLLREKTRPEVEAAIRRAEAGYKEGNATYLIVLEANRQLVATFAREAQLSADLRRAWAELERGVGRRLASLPQEPTP